MGTGMVEGYWVVYPNNNLSVLKLEIFWNKLQFTGIELKPSSEVWQMSYKFIRHFAMKNCKI